MAKRIVALDLDGNLTEFTKKHGDLFRDSYITRFSDRVPDLPLPQVQTEFAEFETIIRQNPQEYGWWRKGRYVSSPCDIFLIMSEAARLILDRRQLVTEAKARSMFLYYLYRDTYRECPAGEFRPETLPMLLALRKRRVPTYIITNSETDEVRRRMAQLGWSPGNGINELYWLDGNIIGGACKFEVTGAPAHLPETISVNGLRRPVFIQRGDYYARLQSILERHHEALFEDLIVVGDNAELDLVLPHAAGARVILFAGVETPAYEIQHFKRQERSAVVFSLNDAMDQILAWL